MESRKELAAEKKRCGSHNCTQSVLCTYCDLTGLDEDTIKHAGNCFAAGMGNGEGTCGSIVGAGIVYGLAVRDRAKAVKGMRQIMEKFQERNGATRCKLLRAWARVSCCANVRCAFPTHPSFWRSCWRRRRKPAATVGRSSAPLHRFVITIALPRRLVS